MKEQAFISQSSPCRGCSRVCNYTQCREYRLWLNRSWNRFRRFPEQLRPPVKRTKTTHWQYESPVLLQDYVEKGPCGSCPLRSYCGDKESCAAYDAWVELRWTLLRRRLGLKAGA